MGGWLGGGTYSEDVDTTGDGAVVGGEDVDGLSGVDLEDRTGFNLGFGDRSGQSGAEDGEEGVEDGEFHICWGGLEIGDWRLEIGEVGGNKSGGDVRNLLGAVENKSQNSRRYRAVFIVKSIPHTSDNPVKESDSQHQVP